MISIVTGTLNRLGFLPGLISNTVGAHPLLELVLVDGGSTDGTLEFLRGLGNPRVKLVEVGHRSSYAHFMNLGVRASSFEYVCQWNDDVLLANSWDEVIAELDAEHDFYLFNWKDGSRESTNDPDWIKGEDKRDGWMLINNLPRGEIVVNYGIYTKRIFRTIGLYCNDYYHYYADGDMSARAAAFGFKEKTLRHIKVVSLTGLRDKRAVNLGEDSNPDKLALYHDHIRDYRNGVLPSSLEFL